MRACRAAVEDLDAEGRAAGAGSSGAGPSGNGAVSGHGGAEGGMRIYLSQIKEWMVEYACDMCFIIIRTDCAWYKIRSVHEEYAGWFDPILKVARLAVGLLGMIQVESRSSRVSFSDLAKRLSAAPATAPTFLSSKVDLVRSCPAAHSQLAI